MNNNSRNIGLFQKMFGFSRLKKYDSPSHSSENIRSPVATANQQTKLTESKVIDGKETWKDGWKIRYDHDGEIRVQSLISEFSVDSTEVTQIESSFGMQLSHTTDFKHMEIVWAKRSTKSWYPAILFTDPFDQSKQMKHLMKQLDVTHVPFSQHSHDCQTQGLKNVLLFDTHKTWLLLPADRIRKFDIHGFNQYYLEALRQLNYKERNDIKKAYKRANKLFAQKKKS